MIQRAERLAGMPARYVVPVLIASVSLQVAVLGMYWDVGYHIDHGRDQGVLTLPHLLIVAGLQGIVIAALLHGVLRGPAARNERRIPALGLRMSPGGIVILVCGAIALLGFPLDAAWHALFGEDVTLWGPTHLFMIGGAGVSTLGLWMVTRQGFELGRPRRIARRAQLRIAGALIIGLSTFQAEFDFGVPQFQLLYQPVLIAFAAGVALVCARSTLGRWGAFQVLGLYFAIRGLLALFVGVVVGYTTPHFPLYLAEAAAVELAAERPVPVGGNWKTMVRLAKGSHLEALPVYLLPSPQSGRPGVPVAVRSGPMVADTFLLQREARGGPGWLTTTAYAALAAIVAIWLALLTWALGLAEPRGQARERATVASQWPPPVAPA